MALDHLIGKARDHFQIVDPADWQNIRPEWVRGVPGCGPATLNHIRLYLAARGLTLRDDATPAFWQKNLQTAKIGSQVSLVDTAETEAFTVLIDSQEKQPWTFQGFKRNDRSLIVPIKWQSLGPTHGDYSIAGFEGQIHIERKSVSDAHGTFLAPPDSERGGRWQKTLAFLAQLPAAAVVVECSFLHLINSVQPRGKRSASTLRKTLHHQVIAWQQDLLIPFLFCDSRRFAEATVLYWMRRKWMHETGIKTKSPVPDPDAVASL